LPNKWKLETALEIPELSKGYLQQPFKTRIIIMFAVLTDDTINLFPTIDEAVSHADNWHFCNRTTTARIFRPDVFDEDSRFVEVIHYDEDDEVGYRRQVSGLARVLQEAEWARS
jgi:hypothetical protein